MTCYRLQIKIEIFDSRVSVMMQCTLAMIKHELFDDKGYSNDNIRIRPSLKRGTGFEAWKFETKLI